MFENTSSRSTLTTILSLPSGIFAPLSKISKVKEGKKNTTHTPSTRAAPHVRSQKVDVAHVTSKVNSGRSSWDDHDRLGHISDWICGIRGLQTALLFLLVHRTSRTSHNQGSVFSVSVVNKDISSGGGSSASCFPTFCVLLTLRGQPQCWVLCLQRVPAPGLFWDGPVLLDGASFLLLWLAVLCCPSAPSLLRAPSEVLAVPLPLLSCGCPSEVLAVPHSLQTLLLAEKSSLFNLFVLQPCMCILLICTVRLLSCPLIALFV